MPQEKFVKREYNNGHKTFTADEAKAFQELLRQEKSRRDNFERNKESMIRDRNPLIGDPTPRINLMTGEHINQEPIINPNWIPRPLPDFVTKKEKLTEKIGIETSKYHFLGNNYVTRDQITPEKGSSDIGSRDNSRPLTNAGTAVVSSPSCSRPPTSISQQSRPPTTRSTCSRPGSDWKNRITEEGTLRPMIRFF